METVHILVFSTEIADSERVKLVFWRAKKTTYLLFVYTFELYARKRRIRKPSKKKYSEMDLNLPMRKQVNGWYHA